MKEMGDPVLRRWQSNLTEEMNKTPDPRKIIWYNDPEGNTGKTFIAKLLCLKHSAIRFENAKSADIKYAYRGQNIVVFDLSRSQEAHFNYEVLESVKNGVMFSTKYESTMKMHGTPHVIVFANWTPEKTRLSLDRWTSENSPTTYKPGQSSTATSLSKRNHSHPRLTPRPSSSTTATTKLTTRAPHHHGFR